MNDQPYLLLTLSPHPPLTCPDHPSFCPWPFSNGTSIDMFAPTIKLALTDPCSDHSYSGQQGVNRVIVVHVSRHCTLRYSTKGFELFSLSFSNGLVRSTELYGNRLKIKYKMCKGNHNGSIIGKRNHAHTHTHKKNNRNWSRDWKSHVIWVLNNDSSWCCSYSNKRNIWCDVQCRGARKLLPKRLLVLNKACRIRASKLSSGDAAAAECPDEGELFSRCACRVPLPRMFVVLPPLVAHLAPSIQTSARDWLLFRSRTL